MYMCIYIYIYTSTNNNHNNNNDNDNDTYNDNDHNHNDDNNSNNMCGAWPPAPATGRRAAPGSAGSGPGRASLRSYSMI